MWPPRTCTCLIGPRYQAMPALRQGLEGAGGDGAGVAGNLGNSRAGSGSGPISPTAGGGQGQVAVSLSRPVHLQAVLELLRVPCPGQCNTWQAFAGGLCPCMVNSIAAFGAALMSALA